MKLKNIKKHYILYQITTKPFFIIYKKDIINKYTKIVLILII